MTLDSSPRRARACGASTRDALARHPDAPRALLCVAALVLPVLTVRWAPLAKLIGGTRPFPDFLSLDYATYYVAPMTFIAPLWAATRLDWLAALSARQIAIDGVVFTLSATRSAPLFTLVPLSGHALFLSYTALTTRDRRYAALALVGLVGTTYLKLVEWRDPITWGIGLAIGVVLARLFRRHSVAPCAASTSD